jgi:hypothetical protein
MTTIALVLPSREEKMSVPEFPESVFFGPLG